MKELDELLQHHGVKGQKWGVIRKGQNGIKSATKRVKEEVGSLKRERSWGKNLANADKMSTKQINKVAQRIQMENDLKRLSKDKYVGSKKDKANYRNRGKMSDEELGRKVGRLRAKANLNRTIQEATKSQSDFGKRVVGSAGPLAVKYVLGQKIGPKDLFEAAHNSKSARNEAKESLGKEFNRRVQNSKKGGGQ